MIELSITGDVAEVVLNAPAKLNALSLRELGEMDAAYRSAEESGVRALVLRAEPLVQERVASGIEHRPEVREG